jgi:TonB family protein
MAAVSCSAHFLLVLALLLGRRTAPPLQTYQVSLVSSASIPARIRPSSLVTPPMPRSEKAPPKQEKVQPKPSRVRETKDAPPPPLRDDPDGLQTWWKKKMKTLSKKGRSPAPEVSTPDSKPSPADSPPTPPQKMAIRTDGPPVTGMVSADPPLFQFPYYLTQVEEMINRKWSPPTVMLPDAKMAVMVHFRINKRGEITVVEVEKSSGNDFFDQAALRAVYEAKRFPPFPPGLTEEALNVHYRFIFQGDS